MRARFNRRRHAQSCSNLNSRRNGFVALGFEGFFLLMAVAAVLTVALFLRNQGRKMLRQEENLEYPIRKLAAPTGGSHVVAQRGISQLFSVDCVDRSSTCLHHKDGVCCWESSSDGRVLLTTYEKHHLSVFIDDEIVIDQQQESANLYPTTMSPDGSLIVAITDRQFVRCWNLKTGEVTEMELKDQADNIALDSSQQRLYVNTTDGRLQSYRIQSGAEPELQLETFGKSRLSLTNDQKWLVAFQGNSVAVYEINSFSKRWTWEADLPWPTQFATSQDSRRIAIVRLDGQLLVKSISTGETLMERSNPNWQTTSICFTGSDDGLALGQKDGSLVFCPLGKQTIVPAPITVQ